MAAVICVGVQADLTVDLYALMSSVYLEDKPIYFLQVRILIYILVLQFLADKLTLSQPGGGGQVIHITLLRPPPLPTAPN